MTEAYWIAQFTAVLAFYAFVLFLWPSIVFRSFLRGRSRTFRFSFCTTGMVLLINLAVLAVGLIPHALHIRVTAALFYGIFAVQVWRQCQKQRRAAGDCIRRLIGGTMGYKSLLVRLGHAFSAGLYYIGRKIRNFFRGHGMEYGILIALCAYAVLYFGWGAFDMRTYGFGDMYVHHAWIDGLQNGEIFSAGIYPEGMHTFIYLLSSISGIRVYSILLFLAPIHSAVLMVSIWIFLRQIFQWKYSALMTVLLFLILEQNSINDIYSMSRIQWTIPQEFALYTEFLCGAFLLRFLREEKPGKENLLLFAMAVAASFATHFYVTIMAAMLCIGIVISRFGSFWRYGRWKKIILTAVISVIIPLVPMVAAFAEGHPLQGSLGWAINVMEGKDSDSDTDAAQGGDSAAVDSTYSAAADSTYSAAASPQGDTAVAQEPAAETEPAQQQRPGLLRRAAKIPGAVYSGGFLTIYSETKGKLFAAAVALVLALSSLTQVFSGVFHRQKLHFADGALAVSLGAALFMLDYAASDAGLPQLIAGARVLTSERLLLLAVCMAVPDRILFVLCRRLPVRAENTAGMAFVCGLFAAVVLAGEYHGYLYYEQSRYTEAAETTNRIIDRTKKNSYTIVSTTDELYQVKGHGYHEELLTLVKTAEDTPGYSLPTEYIYVFVEKKPLQYGQTHFFRGPAWLAVNGKNTEPYHYYSLDYSESPDTLAGSISASQAKKALNYVIGDSNAGKDPEGRVILESKAMRWVQEFKAYYPHDISTYFEDEKFVCYEIRQDPQIPYKLGFDAK